jgi:hypothetical protein
MKLARKCREHAFALQEMAEAVPDQELELQLRGIAQKWLVLASLREQPCGIKIKTEKTKALSPNAGLNQQLPTFPASL